MTEKRYWEIRNEYKIYASHFPTKEQIENMTEEQLRKQMETLMKAFNDVFAGKFESD